MKGRDRGMALVRKDAWAEKRDDIEALNYRGWYPGLTFLSEILSIWDPSALVTHWLFGFLLSFSEK